MEDCTGFDHTKEINDTIDELVTTLNAEVSNPIDELKAFSRIIEIPSKTANQLYIQANSWMVEFFNNSKSVIQFCDKESGIVKGKNNSGSSEYDLITMTGGVSPNVARSFFDTLGISNLKSFRTSIITILVQDNKTKISVDPDNQDYTREDLKQFQSECQLVLDAFDFEMRSYNEW